MLLETETEPMVPRDCVNKEAMIGRHVLVAFLELLGKRSCNKELVKDFGPFLKKVKRFPQRKLVLYVLREHKTRLFTK